MAWNNRYNPQPAPIPGAESAMAVDWEVKKIPGLCYKAAIMTKEALLLARGGLDNVPKAFIRFVATVESFYTSIDTEFNKYLASEEYRADSKLPVKENKSKYTQEDFTQLNTYVNGFDLIRYKDTLNMFTIMRWWCFTKGPFRVYNDVEPEDVDVFDRLEDEIH